MNPGEPTPSVTPREFRPAGLFWLALALAALPLYGRYLLGDLPVGADNTLFYAPFFSLHWRGGPPLWNPYALAGAPLIDNLQAALLYPPRWPFYFVADWRDYFGLFVFLHYPIALAGMAGLLRALGMRRLAALGGAILFATGGHMAGRTINLTIFMGCCWLPWLMWGAAGGRRVHAWLSVLAMAMIGLIGSPHLLFYGLIAYAVVFLFCGVRAPGIALPHFSRSAIFLAIQRALALGLGLLLAAPTLLPGVLRAQGSIRALTTVEANLADSATFGEILPILLGGVGGTPLYPEYIDKCGYLGPVALALILWLACRRAAWRDRRFLAGLLLTALGFIFALGKNVGLDHVLPWIPGVRTLAGAARAIVLVAAGGALLTALALDALTARATRRLALVLGAAGLAALAAGLVRAAFVARAADSPELFGIIGRAWAVAPCLPDRTFYPLFDAAGGLMAAGLILALPAARDRLRLGLLCGLLLALCWHFSPRVLPPTERRPFFEPPPQAAYLRAARDRAPQAPFRVAGYDPLRLHDYEFDGPHKFRYLMPNVATLYGLEDINGFDPLIARDTLDLFLRTAGRAPHNDPIRNLDLARPDAALFDFLGVRFLVGHPYDRRLTLQPLTLGPGRPAALVEAWNPAQPGGAVTAWSFVSLLDRALGVPLGAEVARLHIEADEGTFEFPIRNGVESADLKALNNPSLARSPAFRAVVNQTWTVNQPVPELNYRVKNTSYRAVIPFGRPLHVRRAGWILMNPDIIFNVAAQVYRLAPPPQGDPWARRLGGETDFAPVFEYLAATPRATLVQGSAPPGARNLTLEAARLSHATAPGALEWLARGESGMTLRVRAAQPSLLVLRELWSEGWRAEVGGRSQPVLRLNGLLRAVAVPGGVSTVRLDYRPRLPLALLALSAAALALYAAGTIWSLKMRKDSAQTRIAPSADE